MHFLQESNGRRSDPTPEGRTSHRAWRCEADSDRCTPTPLRQYHKAVNRNRSGSFTINIVILRLDVLKYWTSFPYITGNSTPKVAFRSPGVGRIPNRFILLDIQKCVGLRPLGALPLPNGDIILDPAVGGLR